MSILCLDDSSPDNSSLGYFFARKILRSKRKKTSEGGKFYTGAFVARMILRRIIFR
jgi:hypothetical protein